MIVVSACGILGDKTVVDTRVSLRDGERVAYRLEPGKYRVEITADKDGASVQWVGANCPSSRANPTYSGLCELPSIGQVVVENPTTFGLGASSSVTIKVTKLR